MNLDAAMGQLAESDVMQRQYEHEATWIVRDIPGLTPAQRKVYVREMTTDFMADWIDAKGY